MQPDRVRSSIKCHGRCGLHTRSGIGSTDAVPATNQELGDGIEVDLGEERFDVGRESTEIDEFVLLLSLVLNTRCPM